MEGPNSSGQPRRAPSARQLLLVIVSATFLTTFTGSMINVAIPVIRAEFDASPALIGWVVTGYLLAYAVG
ncbi:MAG: MFS transporter, partial [Clostridia bacterium]